MIARAEVEHVARLARLALSDAEMERMREELSAILAYIDTLARLAIDGVEPTAHAVPITNVMRDDDVRASFPVQAMLANAPDAVEDRMRVPRILED